MNSNWMNERNNNTTRKRNKLQCSIRFGDTLIHLKETK